MEILQHPRAFLSSAVREVSALSQLNLDEDVPSIQAANFPVLLQSNTDTNFNDITAFKSSFARSAEDARVYAHLNTLLEQGQEYATMLYTWRSISRALPFIRSSDQPNRIKIYEKTKEILEPHCLKLKQFMFFQDAAIRRFVEEVKRLAHKDQKNFFVNQAYLVTLGKMIKMFALLDEMKNMKASMKNDYSNYKRAAQFLQVHDPDAQDVSIFLAKQKIIRDTLKDSLIAVDGYEDLLVEIIHNSAQMYENKVYVLPEEKHTHVIVIAFSLYLLDSARMVDGKQIGVCLNKIAKRLNISKLDRILKECEVVNLFGDMSVEPFSYVRQTASFDPSKWPECHSTKVSIQGAILTHMARFQEEYTSLTSDLAWHTNITSIRLNERSAKENQELYDLALRGLQYLSGWSVQVLDTFTWKLAHCASGFTNHECPKDAENYEKATRYNYNSEERFAMVEIISMIKSVQTQLLRLEACYSEAIGRSVYRELQAVVVGQLTAPLLKAQKKKERIMLTRLIHAIQATCADQLSDSMDSEIMNSSSGSGTTGSKSWGKAASSKLSNSSNNNNSMTAGANSTLAAVAASLANDSPTGSISTNSIFDSNKRRVGPSSSQLYLVRTMLELLVEQVSSSKQMMRKELDASTLSAIDTFLKHSFYWPYLLNFSDTLIKCCDLSQLWYREFFLEMTNGACIQFPIEMSLPWIFTDHILETEHPGYMEYLLYMLDLYNDAADCALNRFRRRFLYEEIEAEANLVFDQLVYKLSDKIFRHYKRYAASILLDKRFRAEAQRTASWREPYPPPNRYTAALLHQKNIQLLGRSIDLNRLICQRMNTALYKSLEVAISRFHGSDITGIIELEAAIECNRLCHRMLSEHLDLDDFDALLREADNLVTSRLGKITVHVFWELTYDLVKNYCYNDATNRFVPTNFTLTEVLEREKPPTVEAQYVWGSRSLNTCFETIFKLYRGFVGAPHFSAICRLLGYRGLYVVIAEVMKVAQSLLNQTLRDYVCRLIRLLPQSLTLPSEKMESDAVFSALYSQLQKVYGYTDLRTNVFQNFRELGNILICCLQLEKNLSIEDSCDLRHAGPFIGQMPRQFFPPLPSHDEGAKGKPINELRREREIQYKELQKKQESMNIVLVVSRIGTEDQLALAKENEILTKERLCSGLTLFEFVLNKIKSFLHEEDSDGNAWHRLTHLKRDTTCNNGSSQHNNTSDILGLESCAYFHRLWSVIQLVFCTPFGQNEYTVEEMFGEGINWAGCAIILLLGQQRRFEALDFGTLILRLQRIDKKDSTPMGVSLERLAARLSRFSVLNRQIFSTLSVYLHPIDRVDETSVRVRQFPLPTWSKS
ncbi:unnamed protein product [Trichobilharzia szidati]|nr:unnamed protein product [Trichobilharzia szidati]